MPDRICPKCQRTGRRLAASSENSLVDYYRCDSCGHVWTLDRQGGRRDVTVPMKTQTDEDKTPQL